MMNFVVTTRNCVLEMMILQASLTAAAGVQPTGVDASAGSTVAAAAVPVVDVLLAATAVLASGVPAHSTAGLSPLNRNVRRMGGRRAAATAAALEVAVAARTPAPGEQGWVDSQGGGGSCQCYCPPTQGFGAWCEFCIINDESCI